ncbi:MAG TPA: hypothetical protein VGJ14_06780 [Sporichthyaceae bacterium]
MNNLLHTAGTGEDLPAYPSAVARAEAISAGANRPPAPLAADLTDTAAAYSTAVRGLALDRWDVEAGENQRAADCPAGLGGGAVGRGRSAVQRGRAADAAAVAVKNGSSGSGQGGQRAHISRQGQRRRSAGRP